MPSNKRRIFIGIPIPIKLQKQILNWEKENLSGLKLRLIAGKNLHITLIPPWYENKLKIKNLKLKIIGNKIKPFKIKFDKVKFGPIEKSPRLIWAEGEVPRELLILKTLLEKAFNKMPEKRKFLTHLTLARFNPRDFKNFQFKKLDRKVNWVGRVEEIALFESHLSPKGANYDKLERAKLKEE